MHRELGVPVGIINSSWGGTQIESWLGADALRAAPAWEQVSRRWQAELERYPARLAAHEAALARWEESAARARAENAPVPAQPRAPEGPGSRREPSGLFNGMVHPFVSLAVRGILWYQGESNADRHEEYADLFRALITQWRRDFNRDELPFYFVQVANFNVARDPGGQQWANLREAQAKVLDLPNTGMAVTIDIGDPDNVHPADKQEVGRRLALVALAKEFGRDIECRGPAFRTVRLENGRLRVLFDHAAGLVLRTGDGRAAFELAGADGEFRPAEAGIDGETVVLSAADVLEPVAVRYAWRNDPPAPLYNGAGLPAEPFRWQQPNAFTPRAGDG
jgi:sialate O-acetylesterase